MKVKFYDYIEDSLIKFVVIVSRSNGKWILCKHKNRDTYEFPGGRREKGENVRHAAERELYEETGADDYCIKPVGVYSVVGKTRVNESGEESFGMLYYAEVKGFEKELHYEIENIVFMDEFPANSEMWTYPLIQPKLYQKVIDIGYVMKKEELFEYVKNYLDDKQGNISQNPKQQFRNRYEHIIRVVQWVKLLAEDMKLNYEALIVAAIFHDVGYEVADNENHAYRSAEVFKQFALSKKLDNEFIKQVYDIILHHSKKELLGSDNPIELTILMEADLLDEEGTMRIVRDCMAEGANSPLSYKDAYLHIVENKKVGPNPMVTEKAKRIWDEKKKMVSDFLVEFKNDLFME